MEVASTTELLAIVEEKEKRERRRTLYILLIPCIAALLFLGFTTYKVTIAQQQLQKIDSFTKSNQVRLNKVQAQLNTADSLNKTLKNANDSLSTMLQESATNLGKAVSVTNEFRTFIDKMQPYLRSQQEASFYINFRMMEDKVRGNYETLSQKISNLPDLDTNKNWLVIVQSSMSLEDLRNEAPKLISEYGADQVAIYQDSRKNYALSVKGNGTFTRAYRLNVELRDKYGYQGAYFSPSLNWGSNYLK
jgi:hypothetical protein